jgi:hypothetical protein
MTDLQIRIFAPQNLVGETVTCRVEARLDESQRFAGDAMFDRQALLQVQDDPIAYGRRLRDALLASSGLQRAYLKAAALSPVRFRLLADSAEIAALRWERLMLDADEDDRPAAASPQTPFSRYIELEEPPTASTDVPCILLAIANPTNLKNLAPIDVDDEVDNLLDAWKVLLDDGNLRLVILPGRTPLSDETTNRLDVLKSSCRLAAGPTTLDTLSGELQRVDGLHLIAHGNLHDGKAVLWLEKEDGSAAMVQEEALRVKFQQPRLRFAFLHSCKGSAGSVGLGPRLVEFGVPAVIAMQDFVPMGDARRFATAFYAKLIQEGAVDIAANAGRQAIFRSRSDNWAIPVLFCRLKDAQIWKAEPVRAAVQKLAKRYQALASVKEPFPLDAVLMRGGLARLQHGTENISGPKLDLVEASRQALQKSKEIPRPFVLLLGNRGRAKSTHLQYLFADASSGSTDSEGALPLLLYLADCIPEHESPAATIAWAVAAAFRRCDINVDGLDTRRLKDAMSAQPFLFLVDGDDDIGGAARTDAIRVLTKFQEEAEQAHQILVTADELTFDPAPYPQRAIALILQTMAIDRVSAYLKRRCPPLENELRKGQLFDLASVPWLLGRLIENSRQGTRIISRAEVLERFVREGLARLEGSAGMRSRAEQVLGRMAWRMQSNRQSNLTGAEVYAILADVRGNRDFQLQQFLEEILKNSGLLVWSGMEGVRFAYPGLQWHYCAKYLSAAPERERERNLEDITATLGRLSRVRWWDYTLVVLAGLTDDPDPLLRKILAGSALTEGEQVFVAARCLHEARRAQRARDDAIGQDVVDQIVDALVWRSRHENVRSTAARQKAIAALSLLAEQRVIPHLVSLAIRKVRRDWEGRKAYDYSNVRLAAVQALFGMRNEALEHVAQDREFQANQTIQHLLKAWLKLDVAKLGQLLDASDGDGGVSAVAAFALGTMTIETDKCVEQLLRAFRERQPHSGRDDVMWAITDTLTLLNPVRVTKEAIWPRLNQPEDQLGTLVREPWATYLAYLIGKLGVATPESKEVGFLRRSLQAGDEELQGRALRSYAALLGLQGPSAPATELKELRELCHQFVRNEFDGAAAGKLIRCSSSPEPRVREQLQYQALEALRSIGNEESIEVLRKVRQREYDAPVDETDDANGKKTPRSGLNSRLSFEIAEEIYWRLTGGLSAETYAPLRTIRASER